MEEDPQEWLRLIEQVLQFGVLSDSRIRQPMIVVVIGTSKLQLHTVLRGHKSWQLPEGTARTSHSGSTLSLEQTESDTSRRTVQVSESLSTGMSQSGP